MEIIKIRVTLTERMLGLSSGDPEIHKNFIAKKHEEATSEKVKEEMESISAAEAVEKAKTVFPRENGTPLLFDYQIKGWFKDTILARIGADNSLLNTKEAQKKFGLSAWTYKRKMKHTCFIEPRKVLLNMPKGSKIGSCQRPLRAETLRGDRVALANSETVPAGTTMEFEIHLTQKALKGVLLECLDFGRYKGLGQWADGGNGRFTYEIIE